MGFEVRNITVLNPGQLYWIIILECNIKFLIHSVGIFNAQVAPKDSPTVVIDTTLAGLQQEVPVPDLTKVCLEDFTHYSQDFKIFLCHSSLYSNIHNIVVFQQNHIAKHVSRILLFFLCYPV